MSNRLDSQPLYYDDMDDLHDELKVLVEQWLDDAACTAQGSPLLRTRDGAERPLREAIRTNVVARLIERSQQQKQSYVDAIRRVIAEYPSMRYELRSELGVLGEMIQKDMMR